MEVGKVIKESVMYRFIVNYLKNGLKNDNYISSSDINNILIALGEIETKEKENEDE